MTRKELIRQLSLPGEARAWVRLTDNDGCYVNVVKSDLIARLESGYYGDDSVEFKAERSPSGHTLYIN